MREICEAQKLLWKPATDANTEELTVDGYHDDTGLFIRLCAPCKIPVTEIPMTNGVYDVDYIMQRVADHARGSNR